MSPGTFALGKINLAHAAAANLSNATMTANYHRSKSITIFETRTGAQHGERLAVFAGGGLDQFEQPFAIQLAPIQPVQSRSRRGERIGGILEQQQHNRRELTLACLSKREVCGHRSRRRRHDDHRIEADRGKILIEGGVNSKSMLDDDGVGPFDFNMLSDKQSIITARGDQQQAHQFDAASTPAPLALNGLRNRNGLESTTGAFST